MVAENAEKSVRVFLALWPADAERAALAAWQPALHKLCGGRSTRAATLHNTLVFIGNIEPHRLEALQLAAQEAGGEAFHLSFDAAHYWGHNHIVHAAPGSVPPQLARLVHNLEQRLAAHRFEFDKRPYKPHVTLLRNAKWSDAPLPGMREVRWRVEDFALVQSVPDERGANYRVLARFPLHLP
ncbi:MAG: RNA 2',3'-cyclic phosphodiesterase [Nitrosomonadales bacterium]|nr:RNA 2',3'-cyclic phosphodiesterase [Nitrosomonadales bacterium]